MNVEESCGLISLLSGYLPRGAEQNCNSLSGYPVSGFETGTFQIQSGSAKYFTAVFLDVNCWCFRL
jgi:hypothetical protein